MSGIGFQSQLSLSATDEDDGGATIGSAPCGIICSIGGGGGVSNGSWPPVAAERLALACWVGVGPTSVISSSTDLELPTIAAAPPAMLKSEYVEARAVAAPACADCGAASAVDIVVTDAYVHGIG